MTLPKIRNPIIRLLLLLFIYSFIRAFIRAFKQGYAEGRRKREKEDKLEKRIFTVTNWCLVILIAILIFLILLPAEADFKAWVFLTFLVISIIAIFIGVGLYAINYPINEYLKSKLANDSFARIGAYIFPIPLIAFFTLYYFDSVLGIPLPTQYSPTLFDWNAETFLLAWVTYLNYVSLGVALPPLVSKEYNFYVALRYFTKIAHSDTHEKIKLLIKGMNVYNKFLKRNLGLQINGIGRIRSKIIADSSINVDDEVESLVNVFAIHDKVIGPIKAISKLLGDKDADELLVKISILERVRNYSFLYGSITGIIVAIIPFVFG